MCYWPPGQGKSMACQKQRKLLGKSLFSPDLPAKSHYSCPTHPFIQSRTFIEQLPFLSTVRDTKVYKLRRGHKCSGSRCEGVEEEKGLRVQIFLSDEYSGIWRACTEHAYLIKISLFTLLRVPSGTPCGVKCQVSCRVQIPALSS